MADTSPKVPHESQQHKEQHESARATEELEVQDGRGEDKGPEAPRQG